MMAGSKDIDHIISQGTLMGTHARVDYYTTTPTATQWIAVGVMMYDTPATDAFITRRMLVGKGGSEHESIAELRRRFELALREQDLNATVESTPLQARIQRQAEIDEQPSLDAFSAGSGQTTREDAGSAQHSSH